MQRPAACSKRLHRGPSDGTPKRPIPFDAHQPDGVTTLCVAARARHASNQHNARVPEQRGGLALILHGVDGGAYTHRLPTFGCDMDLPQADRAPAEVLSLPVHTSLIADERRRIVTAMTDWGGHEVQVITLGRG
jgi:hypothetical protein